MSATPPSTKLTFVGRLRNLFWRSDVNSFAPEMPTADESAAAVSTATAPNPFATDDPNAPDSNGHRNYVHIPLPPIIATLPVELRAHVVRKIDITDLAVPVTSDKIISQLGCGLVKVSFGEIRQAAPHAFSPSTVSDHVDVVLPLSDIVPLLNPALLARRPKQKRVIVPMDITGPFGNQGQGLVFSVGNAKMEPPKKPQAPAAPVHVKPIVPPASVRSPIAPPPSMVPDQIFKRAPVSPIAPSALAPGKPALPVSTPPPAKPQPPVPPPPKVVPMATPQPKENYFAAPPVARAVRPATPPVSQPTAADAGLTPTLSVSLSALADSWPDAVRQEIVRLNLTNAQVALPTGHIEPALKLGRVAFPWRILRSWIKPAPPPEVSVHDAMELELPLSVLAPLFVARNKVEARPHQRVTVDEAIPNLFFGQPQPEPGTPPAPAKPPVNKTADTNYYIWDDFSDTARVDETAVKRRLPTGTGFITKYATPNEIVSRAAALEGVAGTVIALPDGLMVANRIPSDFNGDTLAAFLPQIFAKVSQSTKELRMGELNNLSFTVGNVPWKIFRVNAIFFAAFGRVGEALPTGPLAELAGELDRKNR